MNSELMEAIMTATDPSLAALTEDFITLNAAYIETRYTTQLVTI